MWQKLFKIIIKNAVAKKQLDKNSGFDRMYSIPINVNSH